MYLGRWRLAGLWYLDKEGGETTFGKVETTPTNVRVPVWACTGPRRNLNPYTSTYVNIPRYPPTPISGLLLLSIIFQSTPLNSDAFC